MKKLFYIVGGVIVLIIIVAIAGGGEKKETELEQQSQSTPKEQVQPEITNYDIQFTAEHLGSRNFKVDGATNLPNGAKIHITIYDEDYFEHDKADPDWRLENLTHFGNSVIVKNGKFTKTLTASVIEAPTKSDKYKVEVFFNPRAQTSSIKKIVGENGEYLGGDLLDVRDAGFTMLETSKLVSLKQEISYKIIEEEDIFYLGCKRVGIRIVVPDDANKIDVDYILGKIINDNKSKWDDITVWAYKYSEEQQVGKIPYTMGMKEYSICK